MVKATKPDKSPPAFLRPLVLSVATLCESGIAERALNKQAQKVKYVPTDIVAEEPETPSGGGSNGGGGNNPPGELEE